MEEKSLIKISLFICMSGDTGLEIITAPRSAAGSERIPKFGRAKWLYKDQRLCLRMSKVFFCVTTLKVFFLKKGQVLEWWLTIHVTITSADPKNLTGISLRKLSGDIHHFLFSDYQCMN